MKPVSEIFLYFHVVERGPHLRSATTGDGFCKGPPSCVLWGLIKVPLAALSWYISRVHRCLLTLQPSRASGLVINRSPFFLLTQSAPHKSSMLVALSSTEGHRMVQRADRRSLTRPWEQAWSLVLLISLCYISNHPTLECCSSTPNLSQH